jgi:hypothetical protein
MRSIYAQKVPPLGLWSRQLAGIFCFRCMPYQNISTERAHRSFHVSKDWLISESYPWSGYGLRSVATGRTSQIWGCIVVVER